MKKLVVVCALVLLFSLFIGATKPVTIKLVAVARSSTPKDGSKEFLVNKEGRKVSNRFEKVWPPDSKGNRLVFDGWYYYFLDKDNGPMFGYEKEKDYLFEGAEPFVNGYSRVTRNGQKGIFREDGNLVYINSFYMGPVIGGVTLCGNEASNEWYHCSADTGLPVYNQRYLRASDAINGFFAAQEKDSKYYLKSLDGKTNFGPYDKAFKPENGFSAVEVGNKANFVDLATGKYVLEKWHDQVFHISEGKAIVWDDGLGHGIWSCTDVATQKVLYSDKVINIGKSINGIAIAEMSMNKPFQPMMILIDSNTGEIISDIARNIVGPDELGYYCFKVSDYQQYLYDPKARQQVYPPLVANKPREYVMKVLGFQNGYCAVTNNDGDAFHVSPKWVRLYETSFDEVSNFAKVEIENN